MQRWRRFLVKPTLSALRRLCLDTRGATAVEYGLILAMVVLTMLIAFGEVARSTNKMWNRVGSEVENAR